MYFDLVFLVNFNVVVYTSFDYEIKETQTKKLFESLKKSR